MYDWADENKKTLKALGPILASPTYIEYYRDVMPEFANEQINKTKKMAFEDNTNDITESEAEELDSSDEDDDDDEEASEEPDSEDDDSSEEADTPDESEEGISR
jgi:hypothetical protein